MKNTKCLVVIFALFGALFTISTSAAGQAVQWTQAEGGNGNWYEAVDIDSTYQAARSYCEDLGGHLVSLTSADEDTWVYTNLDGGDARWIGAYQDINSPEYSEPDGAWGWVSGEAWSYTNWNGDGPDNNDLSVPDEEAGHYCCGGAWNDLYEVTNGSPVERKFIMEWSADCNGDGMVDYGQILNGELTDDDGNGVPDMCEPQQWRVEDGGNGNWYERFSVAQIDWTEAAAAADNQGGYLATMTSVEENAFITSSFPLVDSGPGYWLGGTKEGTGQWQWVTGESWSYEAWNQGDCHPSMQPSDVEGRDYLDMFCQQGDVAYWSNDWDDWTGSLGYVVEWSADCNGDGMVDYGQILSGELADDDGNGVPDVCEECPGDIIDDGVVNLVDFSQFLIDFGSTGESISDLNGDLVVDLNDFSIFLVNYGNVCETRSAVAETGLGKVAPTHHIGGVPRRSMN